MRASSKRIAPTPVGVTSRSGTITTGGTAQNVFTAAQQPTNGFKFRNQSDTIMYLGFNETATTSKFAVPAGADCNFDAGFFPSGLLSVICATTGKAFSCVTF